MVAPTSNAGLVLQPDPLQPSASGSDSKLLTSGTSSPHLDSTPEEGILRSGSDRRNELHLRDQLPDVHAKRQRQILHRQIKIHPVLQEIRSYPEQKRLKEEQKLKEKEERKANGEPPEELEFGVYYVNRVTRFSGSRNHGYVVAGTPGKGRESGTIWFGATADPKRGGADIDSDFLFKVADLLPNPYLDEIDKRRFGAFPEDEPVFDFPVWDAVYALKGNSYSNKEEFHLAYQEVRSKTESNPDKILQEFKQLCFLVPKEKMELWPSTPSGYTAGRANDQEKDIQAFENYRPDNPPTGIMRPFGKLFGFNDVLLEKLDVKVEYMLAARDKILEQRREYDKMHGRIGDGLAHEDIEPTLDKAGRRRLARETATYQWLPQLSSGLKYPPKKGDCNAASIAIAQMAKDMEREDQGLPPGKPLTSASLAGLGATRFFGTRISLGNSVPALNTPTWAIPKNVGNSHWPYSLQETPEYWRGFMAAPHELPPFLDWTHPDLVGAEEKKSERPPQIVVLGDLMINDRDEEALKRLNKDNQLSSAEAVIINLESTLEVSTEKVDSSDRNTSLAGRLLPSFVPSFQMKLERLESILDSLSLTKEQVVFNVANNHANDHDFETWVTFLENNGYKVTGKKVAGQPLKPTVITLSNGKKFGVMGFTTIMNKLEKEKTTSACLAKDTLHIDFKTMKKKEGLDAFMLFPHWDMDYAKEPSEETESAAQFCAERADIVIGTGPHVCQPSRILTDGHGKEVPCTFSPGDFIPRNNVSKKPVGMGIGIHIGEQGIERAKGFIVRDDRLSSSIEKVE